MASAGGGGGGPGGGGGSGSEDTLEWNDDVNERMMDGSPVGGDGSNTARRTPPGDAVVTVEIDTQAGPVQTVGLDPDEVEQAHKASRIMARKVAAGGPANPSSLYNLHVSLHSRGFWKRPASLHGLLCF